MTRLLNLFRRRRDRLERDLDRELRYHIDRRVEDLIKDGLSEPEARRQASLEFGGVPQVQEDVRDTWIWRWLDALVRDVRYAIRSLTRSWGFALGAGAVLALAIGANIAIFSVVNTVLLQPLAYPDAERLVSIETFWTNTGRASQDVSGPDFLDWQARNDVFEKMAVSYGGRRFRSHRPATAPCSRTPRYVSADFFAVFGQTASAGRLLTARDIPVDRRRREPTAAVVAYHWAVTHFGSAEAAIGKTITVYGEPEGDRRRGGAGISLSRRRRSLGALATDQRRHEPQPSQLPGRREAQGEAWTSRARRRRCGPLATRSRGNIPRIASKTVTLIPLQERLTGNLQVTLWVLMSAVGVVWLIGVRQYREPPAGARRGQDARDRAPRRARRRPRPCRAATADRKLCARGSGRTGGSPARVRCSCEDSWRCHPPTCPRIDDVRMDMTVLLFALGLSLVSTVIFGLVPALQASRLDLSDALKQGGSKATGSRASSRLRSALVVIEVALSVILLAAAGLLLRSFQALQHVDLGFTTDRVLVAYTDYAVRRREEDIRIRSAFYTDLLDRLRAVPGVSAAAGVAYLPMGREPRAARDYFIQGRPEGQPGERPQAEHHAITPDYFETLEIPVRAGRDFDRTDTPERPEVAIINEALARIAFPGESPLGQHIRTNSRSPWMEIVGVVADTRWQDPSHPAAAGDLRPHRRRARASRCRSWLGPRWTSGRSPARFARSCTTRIPPCRSGSRRWRSCSTSRWPIPGFARR